VSSSSSSISLSLKKYKRLLNYPSPVGKGLLATVFDEFFYGPELFVTQHKIRPRYYFGKPLINNDKLIIKEHTVKCLSHKFSHNLAIVSGRSKIAAEYSLGPILDYFNKKASVFLEDEVRGYAKPNPYALISALKNLNVKSAIYVGDSTEDILMARKAEQRIGAEIVFVGAYGHAIDTRGTIRQFKDRKADAIIENVNQLPNIINKVETGN
jgi:HAD superfamily phosphatase